jgi:hypothetical protein
MQHSQDIDDAVVQARADAQETRVSDEKACRGSRLLKGRTAPVRPIGHDPGPWDAQRPS